LYDYDKIMTITVITKVVLSYYMMNVNVNSMPTVEWIYTPCLRKKQSKMFSSELRQISTNFDNFWHKDGQDNRIM